MQTIEQFSLEAEQSVIGALMMDNDSIDRMGDLKTEHFYRGDHRVIFAEILNQIVSGKPCDLISLLGPLSEKVQDCASYLNQMQQSTPSSANIARYAGIVRDRAIKRALMSFGADVADEAAVSQEDSANILDRATSKLESLAESRIVEDAVRASDEMYGHIEELERRREGKGEKAIATGYPDLDKRLSGGLRRGGLYIVAARPKMGKTAFALNVTNNVAVDHTALIISLEMPKSEIHDRNIASIGHIPLDRVMQPAEMKDEDWCGLTRAVQKINDLNLYLIDKGVSRLMDVKMKAKQVKRKHGLDVLVIDYLQLMEGDGDNRNSQIEQITRGLKSLAKDLGIAIVLLSQLNRDLEKRPNKRPQPSDLRDSGAIEQDADVVIFLYRDEVYNLDSLDKGTCEVNVALCRQGAPGLVALTYIGEQTRFENHLKWIPPQHKPEAFRRGFNKDI